MHRRSFILGIAGLPLIASAGAALAQSAGDIVPTSAGDVTLTPVSHAGLVIGFGAEAIYVDPTGGAKRFAGLPPPTAILITHAHGDHYDIPTLLGIAGDSTPIFTNPDVLGALPKKLQSRATALANGESGAHSGIPIDAIAAYNTTPARAGFHPPGIGNGYVLTFGDKRIYVAGDTEPTPEMLALTGIEVAFLPMNLPYTMSVEQAAEAIKAFRPKIVYPYHYQGSDPTALTGLVGDAAEIRLRDWYPA
jgi:L-ascorbate metabolism protein UlaG (beta-lactamase superfamily)